MRLIRSIVAGAIAPSLLIASPPLVLAGSSEPGSQIGFVLGASDVPGMFLNWIHGEGGLQGTFNPADFDANGYPNIAPPTTTSYNSIYALPSLTQYSGSWEYGFSGTGARRFQGVGLTLISDPNHCTTTTAGRSIAGGLIEGTNCDVTFKWATPPPLPPSAVGLQWVAGARYVRMSNEFLIRSSDKAAYLAGQILTPEFISVMRSASPLFIRTLGLTFPNQQDQNCASWAYRTPATANSWIGGSWFPRARSPSITGSDQYAAAAAPNTPAAWTDQEMLQGTFANPSKPAITISHAAADVHNHGFVQLTVNSTATLNTGQQVLAMNVAYQMRGQNLEAPHIYTVTVIDDTHVDLQGTPYSSEWSGGGILVTTTIDIAARGPKFVVSTQGMGAPRINAGASGTLSYDAPLNLVFYSPGPEMCGMPFEEQTELANEIGRSLWLNIPQLFRPPDVAALTAYESANLRADLYLEVANENWNPLWTSFQYFYQRGYAMGLVLSGYEALLGTVGVLDRQMFAAARAAWRRSPSSLITVSAVQVNGGSPNLYEKFAWSGSVLCGVSCGNPAYQNAVGTDYNVAPNRPKDYITAYSGTTYFSGATQNGNSGTLAQLAGLINAGTEFAAGDNTEAFNFIDADNRSGRCPTCPGNIYTIANNQAHIFPQWNMIAVSDRKKLIAYEGGLSSFGPSASYLAGLGDANATVDAININNLEIAYRSSPQFYATYIYQNQAWFTFPTVIGNAQLQARGSTILPNQQAWCVLKAGYLNAAPYQSYYAIRAVNGGGP